MSAVRIEHTLPVNESCRIAARGWGEKRPGADPERLRKASAQAETRFSASTKRICTPSL